MNAQVVLDFIKAINQHDINNIAKLLAEDHIFINSHDKEINGWANMKQAWKGYFEFFPDYTIEIVDIIEDSSGSVFGIFGHAHGTYMNRKNDQKTNYWCLPCAWKAMIENGKIKKWQVFSDTKIPYDIIEANLE